MLNHKFNAFKKQKSKSKIFITILCIFGLLFSYSCSCKNNVTGPGNDGLENGKVTNITPPTTDNNTLTGGVANNNGGYDYTPETHLSSGLMVVSSDGNTASEISISIKNADLDVNQWTISGDGITKDDFNYKSGVLSLKKASFSKATADKKTISLNIKYKKTSQFGANDTLSKTEDTETFELVKATEVTTAALDKIIQGINMAQVDKYAFPTASAKDGVLNSQNSIETLGTELNPTYFIEQLASKYLLVKKDYTQYPTMYTNVVLEKMTPEDGNAEMISFKIKFLLTPEYDGACYYTLELRAVSIQDGKGKWTTQK